MLRKKTSATRYNKIYNHNFEFMGWGGVVGSVGGVVLIALKTIILSLLPDLIEVVNFSVLTNELASKLS